MIEQILEEDGRRVAALEEKWNPITGEGSWLERERVEIAGFPIAVMWVPVGMLREPLVATATKVGVDGILTALGEAPTEENRAHVIEELVRLRCRYDFAFWCRTYVYIKRKGGGDDTLFKLNRPQRKLVAKLEAMRTAGKPIRLIILKARQWGGSTCTQIYMAWLQLVHKKGLNSLIVAHIQDASYGIKDMFDKMLDRYPAGLLHPLGEAHADSEVKVEGVGGSKNIKRVPQRNCLIKVGSAETPDSARGGDYNLVHLSEVGVWKATDKKTPEDIVRSATSGVLLKPYTMIVYESTANGTGNFFQREYDAARAGRSQFESLFISWYEIEQYTLPFADEAEREAFALRLLENKDVESRPSDREATGKYLWRLWEMGATLEAIHWYVAERSKYNDDGGMASEYPSDDIEAFVYSGARVFDRYRVEELRGGCRPPVSVGELSALGDSGEGVLEGLHYSADRQGCLWVWEEPDIGSGISDRYLVVVDIGGRSNKADWSVIVVFDRIFMMDGDKPAVVAQWYGHTDIDLLAWKAAQVAAWYDNALLVIESNTLETHDRERDVDGDQSSFILNQIKDIYPNLYARKQSPEDIRDGKPVKYGFHTNVKTKPMLISTLVKCVRDHLYVERDERCLDEYIAYERKENGAYGAIPGKHDDLLMTRAIGLHICFYEMDMPSEQRHANPNRRRNKAISEATI